MELKINNETLVRNVQHEFNTMYPFLKIEFYHGSRKNNDKFLKSEKLGPFALFNQSAYAADEITIDVNKGRTVAELEKDFQRKFGVAIQLYRKSGNVWIETTLTDDWTLERQNKAGEVLSLPMLKKPA